MEGETRGTGQWLYMIVVEAYEEGGEISDARNSRYLDSSAAIVV